MAVAKPSAALLREMSDEAVLQALMDTPRLTRAELAVLTGLSKPTTGEAIRRLEAAGLVRDTGARTSSRGGVGSYYALADDVGFALAINIAPEGVAAEVLDAAGAIQERVVQPVRRPATAKIVTAALLRGVRRVVGDRHVRAATVSAADPVDKTTGRLVHLPDAPFVLGALSPVQALASLVDGPIVVDNDVNWAARAERAARAAPDRSHAADNFVYLYLGEGLGCAVISDGEVRRGHHGFAGEIAHVPVRGPAGKALPLTAVFAHLGLRHPNSTAVDVDRLHTTLAGRNGARVARTLAEAIAGLIDAAIAFADPAFVVVAGPWSTAGAFPRELSAVLAERPRRTPLAEPHVHDGASLTGARAAALTNLRREVIARSR